MEKKINIDKSIYFEPLPKMVQESIKQSAAPITSEEQLKKLGENLTKGK